MGNIRHQNLDFLYLKMRTQNLKYSDFKQNTEVRIEICICILNQKLV